MTLEQVQFRFACGTVVRFTSRVERGGFVRWFANVVTRQDRREKRLTGEHFSDDWVQPNPKIAARLVRRADELRAKRVAMPV